VQKFPLRRADQQTWVGGTAVDVTERREAEAPLEASQQMLRIVLDSIPQGVFWKDHESRFLGCNKICARSVGFASPDALFGKNDRELGVATPEQYQEFMRIDQEVMTTGEPVVGRLEPATFPDGSIHWLEPTRPL
jgi:PAS domain S-box-containing protein